MSCNDSIGKGLRSGILLASTLTSGLKRNYPAGASMDVRTDIHAIRDQLEIIHNLFSVLLTFEPEGSLFSKWFPKINF